MAVSHKAKPPARTASAGKNMKKPPRGAGSAAAQSARPKSGVAKKPKSGEPKKKRGGNSQPERAPSNKRGRVAGDAPAKSAVRRSAKTPAAPAGEARPSRKTTRARSGVTDKLATYRSMRDFGKTPEPQGKTGEAASKWKKSDNPFFVIQKHAATRLHYDFRLEVDGVLKSWAVPKGPSMNPADKRLAVHTEDHPLEYADFEGIIPEDEYGGGTVIVWDAGPYRNLKLRAGKEVPLGECHEKGQIEIWVEGRKIRGGFALIHSRMGDNEKNWLLVKMKDKAAEPSDDPVSRQPQSVLSGRTIEEVASSPKKVWSSR